MQCSAGQEAMPGACRPQQARTSTCSRILKERPVLLSISSNVNVFTKFLWLLPRERSSVAIPRPAWPLVYVGESCARRLGGGGRPRRPGCLANGSGTQALATGTGRGQSGLQRDGEGQGAASPYMGGDGCVLRRWGGGVIHCTRATMASTNKLVGACLCNVYHLCDHRACRVSARP